MNISEKYKIVFKEFGLHIKELREKRNISIEKLSDETGIKKEYLKKIENGNAYGVKINKHIFKIAKALKISFSEIFDFKY